jgi:hypothetical protein
MESRPQDVAKDSGSKNSRCQVLRKTSTASVETSFSISLALFQFSSSPFPADFLGG